MPCFILRPANAPKLIFDSVFGPQMISNLVPILIFGFLYVHIFVEFAGCRLFEINKILVAICSLQLLINII